MSDPGLSQNLKDACPKQQFQNFCLTRFRYSAYLKSIYQLYLIPCCIKKGTLHFRHFLEYGWLEKDLVITSIPKMSNFELNSHLFVLFPQRSTSGRTRLTRWSSTGTWCPSWRRGWRTRYAWSPRTEAGRRPLATSRPSPWQGTMRRSATSRPRRGSFQPSLLFFVSSALLFFSSSARRRESRNMPVSYVLGEELWNISSFLFGWNLGFTYVFMFVFIKELNILSKRSTLKLTDRKNEHQWQLKFKWLLNTCQNIRIHNLGLWWLIFVWF